ncbi:MAG TPA: hypothetical protein VF432_09510 [Thermoanaerobaculia bacterium]
MKTYRQQTDPLPEVPAPAAQVERVAPAASAEPQYRELTAGAQYVPAPQPPTLLEILPEQYSSTRPPLLYRLAKASEPARPDGRIAQSRTYRAKAFSSGVFYKPVSRCLVEWEER